MCVIIYKPAGVRMPSSNVLGAAARLNPHGCGLMTADGRSLHSLDARAFIDYLLGFSPGDDLAIHFRFATHGSVCSANCHPFYYRGITLMHNGVLPIQPLKDRTDSETYLRRIAPGLSRYGLNSGYASEALTIPGSRFAVAMDGAIRLFGEFSEFGGLYFSNTRPYPRGLRIREDGVVDY